jgi:hypothetical protein
VKNRHRAAPCANRDATPLLFCLLFFFFFLRGGDFDHPTCCVATTCSTWGNGSLPVMPFRRPRNRDWPGVGAAGWMGRCWGRRWSSTIDSVPGLDRSASRRSSGESQLERRWGRWSEYTQIFCLSLGSHSLDADVHQLPLPTILLACRMRCALDWYAGFVDRSLRGVANSYTYLILSS